MDLAPGYNIQWKKKNKKQKQRADHVYTTFCGGFLNIIYALLGCTLLSTKWLWVFTKQLRKWFSSHLLFLSSVKMNKIIPTGTVGGWKVKNKNSYSIIGFPTGVKLNMVNKSTAHNTSLSFSPAHHFFDQRIKSHFYFFWAYARLSWYWGKRQRHGECQAGRLFPDTWRLWLPRIRVWDQGNK